MRFEPKWLNHWNTWWRSYSCSVIVFMTRSGWCGCSQSHPELHLCPCYSWLSFHQLNHPVSCALLVAPPTAQFDLCKRAVAQSVNGRHSGYNSQSFCQVPCDYACWACWHCDGDKFPSPNTECRRVSIVSDLGAAIREPRVGWFSVSPWIYIPYNGTWNVSHFPWKLEFHVVLLHGT